jgi:hypothetical protein
MPFNINEFIAEIDKSGVSRTDSFDVIFAENSNLTYRAKSVGFPGRSIQTSEYFELGPEYKFGSFVAISDIAIEFICDENLSEREYFLEWQDQITGKYRNGMSTVGQTFLQPSYYKEYTKTININVYSPTGRLTREVQLLEAFPATINEINYSWDTSEHAILSVSFAYRYFNDGPSINTRTRNITT